MNDVISNTQQAGYEDHTKLNNTGPAQPINHQAKLNDLVFKSNRVLFKCSTIFPFDIFPDQVVIDENKLTIINQLFFWSSTTYSILIKNILGVTVSSGLFFSTLNIEVIGFEENPEPVKYLLNEDARKIKRIITGLIACAREGIDTSEINYSELIRKTEEIGRLRAST
jgi:hypothetical protein